MTSDVMPDERRRDVSAMLDSLRNPTGADGRPLGRPLKWAYQAAVDLLDELRRVEVERDRLVQALAEEQGHHAGTVSNARLNYDVGQMALAEVDDLQRQGEAARTALVIARAGLAGLGRMTEAPLMSAHIRADIARIDAALAPQPAPTDGGLELKP